MSVADAFEPLARDCERPLPVSRASVDALVWAVRSHERGHRVALAILLDAVDGGPRSAGAVAAFDEAGSAFGTLSAGCVDADVAAAAADAIRTTVARELSFAADPDGFGSGLTCGASLTVRVVALDATAVDLARAFTASIDRGAVRSELAFADAALPPLVYERRRHVRIYGATVFAPCVAAIASAAGMSVTLVDPRPHLLDPLRESIACVDAWPHEHHDADPPGPADAIVVTAHDPKFELPLLERALRSEASYVGALGSRRTADARRIELARRGVSAQQIARLRSPIGLDLGGREPQETALAIVAEIVALGNGATGTFLVASGRPIHPAADLAPLA